MGARIAEMAIGYGKEGFVRVYDQHEFLDETREALELWTERLREILTPRRADDRIPILFVQLVAAALDPHESGTGHRSRKRRSVLTGEDRVHRSMNDEKRRLHVLERYRLIPDMSVLTQRSLEREHLLSPAIAHDRCFRFANEGVAVD